ncbi:AraC family transcriptional regulator [Streptomyces smyrnaeus]|uniref:AraC family transcriptional regulator n=1 Tax=Streptomyces TaxID=1883 RepID=UPI001B358D8E|nr:helix-turn-helix transcriptional regulator [Streptomyces sp. RK75]MBQ0866612.1 helix-turn-helix transcriptional regulator [Streptomyces sp. RK75]
MPPYGQLPDPLPGCDSPPGQQALVVRSFPLPRGSWFEEHRHPAHQLAWCASGLLSVRAPGGTWLLPPSVALWIPAHVPHATGATSTAVMCSPYIAPAHCPVAWPEPTVVAVPPLLRELIDHLAQPGLSRPARERAEGVLFDLLRPVPARDIGLTWPTDPRARTVAEALLADLTDSRPLAGWSRSAGASARTLARLFVAETGHGFGRWRERLRVQEAMPLLAQGRSVESVAHRVGYASSSAFIAAFRRTAGLTPGQFFR